MAKIKSLFSFLKRLLTSEAKTKADKREKKRKCFFGRFKWNRLPVLSPVKEKRLSDAQEEHNRHALTVAIATAAAAEAAVAAAQAAAEVVRLSRTPGYYLQSNRGTRDLAALKIQTSYRGYLARKALRALKALVRLQAIVRGQAVRRKAVNTLKGLQSLVRIQSQVRARRARSEENQLLGQDKEMEEEKAMLQVTSQRGWHDSLPSTEDTDSTSLGRQEALIKRERMKEYILSLKERRKAQLPKESEADRTNGSLGQWLEQWMDSNEQRSRRDFVVNSNLTKRNLEESMELRLSETQNPEPKFQASPPRRSFHKTKRCLARELDSLGSSVVPNYMSVTESAKARVRSSSMPKQRHALLDTCSDHGSPSKNRPSVSSINSDVCTGFKSTTAANSQQRSPSMKGLLGYRNPQNLSIDSEVSLLHWHEDNIIR